MGRCMISFLSCFLLPHSFSNLIVAHSLIIMFSEGHLASLTKRWVNRKLQAWISPILCPPLLINLCSLHCYWLNQWSTNSAFSTVPFTSGSHHFHLSHGRTLFSPLIVRLLVAWWILEPSELCFLPPSSWSTNFRKQSTVNQLSFGFKYV